MRHMNDKKYIDQRLMSQERDWIIGSTVRITSHFGVVPYLVGLVGQVTDRAEGMTCIQIHGQPKILVQDGALCFYDPTEAERSSR